jgi:hypothetical protein
MMGISIEQARALGIAEEFLVEPVRPRAFTGPAPGRRSKYNARRTQYDGIIYPSKSEANHALSLDLDKDAGIVRHWFRQVVIPLGPDFKTRVDFIVLWADGRITADEPKGVETAAFRKVKELWPKYAEFPLRIFRNGKLVETITPGEDA